MSEPIILLVAPGEPDGADMTFRRAIDCIGEAEESIRIHMFVWRSDEVGVAMAAAVLAAADRGVAVNIIKDVDAFMYERIEMNRKSLFNKPIPPLRRLFYKLIAPTFPNTYVEDDFDFELGDRLMAHPRATIEWVRHTHSKYYIFDNALMLTGSINIEERHRGYRDYMVELRGRDLIQRFDERLAGTAPFDSTRSLDFVLNRLTDGGKCFEIKPQMLRLLAEAKRSVYIEMAYIGDPDVSRAIVEASNRGVAVTMLFSLAANIGNDINYKTMYGICRRSEVVVYLTRKMIHAKLMLIDDEIAILGSANISVFSMQKGVELDLVVRDHPGFLRALRAEIERRINDSEKVDDSRRLANYNRLIALGQQLHQKLT